MPNYTNARYVRHLNASRRTAPRRKIRLNANTAKVSCFYKGMFLLSIALVTMCSWLRCLQELLSWIPHSFLLPEINLALSHRQVSIWLQLKLWISIRSSSFRIRLISSSETRMHASSSSKISRDSLRVQSLTELP